MVLRSSEKTVAIRLTRHVHSDTSVTIPGRKSLRNGRQPRKKRKSKKENLKLKEDSCLVNAMTASRKYNHVVNSEPRPQRIIVQSKKSLDLCSLPRDVDCVQEAARWPSECRVLDKKIRHIPVVPTFTEKYYEITGKEVQPPIATDSEGIVVYSYNPLSAVNYFSRSTSRDNLVPVLSPAVYTELRFDSRFESGNLWKAVRISEDHYQLYARPDLYTKKHTQWFYFMVENMRKNFVYRFSIVNLCKDESLYSVGMKPVMYSTKRADDEKLGWHRCGTNITYFRNGNWKVEDKDSESTFTLSFQIEFPHEGDCVFLAHSYPYTYTNLQEYLSRLLIHPTRSLHTKLRLLCKSLAGNNVYYLTVTAPEPPGEHHNKKKAVVITARVHPGETPSSYMMKGLIDFITGESQAATELRSKFVFKLVPMLNPDGVIVGNSRCSLTARDLNRQYRTVIRETYPSVWHTKVLIKRLMDDCGVELYCDLHAHSSKHNVFIYGCESRNNQQRRLQEHFFPLLLHKSSSDKFSFENCRFRVHKKKESTGRVVMWTLGIEKSFTLEASFAGSTLGLRTCSHFTTSDYESMGQSFCESLLYFLDEAPLTHIPIEIEEKDSFDIPKRKGKRPRTRKQKTLRVFIVPLVKKRGKKKTPT